MLTANIVLMLSIACALASVSLAQFFKPDPLQIVSDLIEEFVANQTLILEAYLERSEYILANHSLTITRLAAYLTAEENRGQALWDCLHLGRC